jgi:arylsulfatase A-like enzyme
MADPVILAYNLFFIFIMFKNKKPNFLIIMVDEMRFPPVYENEELRKWSHKYLKSQDLLRRYATEFRRHYAGATACAPSRGTIFTGQYPSLHGVTQTSGMAKNAADPDVFWLDHNTLPAMGEYFEVNGYKTFYKGKWHVSEADILIPGTNQPLNSFNTVTGVPIKEYEEYYLDSNRLGEYGFNGWVGPEPHGANPNNSGSSSYTGTGGRDIVFSTEVVSLLKQLEKCDDNKPWLVISSFVNPHDITLYGDYAEKIGIYNFKVDPSVPAIPPPPTENENLDTKPTAQKSYKEVYPQALQPISDGEKYRKLYYSYQKYVDEEIYRVLKTLMKSSMYKDTIIIFTADHGDQLGAHGLYQKWYNIYEESLHVPLIIHSPVLFSDYNFTDELTSHVDIIPTMIGLANISEAKTLSKLKFNHTETHKLVGKRICMNLDTTQINYKCDHTRSSEALYFWTVDNPTKGLNQFNPFTQQPYQSVVEPNSIEAVIVYLLTNGVRHLYKYAKYYDPNTGSTTPPEYEMYDLTNDQLETKNLVNSEYSTPETIEIRKKLEAILIEQRNKKMIMPTSTNKI